MDAAARGPRHHRTSASPHAPCSARGGPTARSAARSESGSCCRSLVGAAGCGIAMGRRSGMADEPEDSLAVLIPLLLSALDRLEVVTRLMHPPRLPELAASLGPDDAALTAALDRVRGAAWPEHLTPFRDQIVQAAESVLRAHAGLREAG